MSMKKKIMIATIAIVVIFVFVSVIWRVYPRSLDTIIPMDRQSIGRIDCIAGVSGMENGQAKIDTYVILPVTKGDAIFETILDILYSSEYRCDFRNLYSNKIKYISGDGTHTGMSVTIGIDGDRLIYHPVDKTVLNKLVEYIKENGIAN